MAAGIGCADTLVCGWCVGAGMLRGVLVGLLILVLVVFAYVGYSGYATGRSAGAGDVYADGMASGRPKNDGRAEPAGAKFPATSMPAMPTTGESSGGEANGGGSNGMVTQGGAPAASTGMAVVTDSIAPNPPNGMTFGGSGHYQLYRQGELTWRLNTDTGVTCVIFATDEEWRKPKVYKAGCRGK